MVWNVLWLAAMTAAAATAGFCMGRLSERPGDFSEEDRDDQSVLRSGVWEVEAAG